MQSAFEPPGKVQKLCHVARRERVSCAACTGRNSILHVLSSDHNHQVFEPEHGYARRNEGMTKRIDRLPPELGLEEGTPRIIIQ